MAHPSELSCFWSQLTDLNWKDYLAFSHHIVQYPKKQKIKVKNKKKIKRKLSKKVKHPLSNLIKNMPLWSFPTFNLSQWLVFNIWSYINSFYFTLFSPYFHIYYKTITFLKEKNLKQLTDLHAKHKTVAARQHFLNSFFGTNMNPFILGWCTTFLHLFLLREKESCHLKCFNVKKKYWSF